MNSEVWFFSNATSRSTDLLPEFTQCLLVVILRTTVPTFPLALWGTASTVVCMAESYHLQPFWLGRWSRPQRKVYFFLRLGGIRKNSLTVRVIRHWNRLPCPERGRVTISGGVWEASGNDLLFTGLQWQCWVDDGAWWSEGLFQPWWVYDLMKKLLFRNHFG